MSGILCGDLAYCDAKDSAPPLRTCQRKATRLSHIYESFSVYVCDIDHPDLDPWMEDTIEDLPDAEVTRGALRDAKRALAAFRRTMRKHERRAKRLGLRQCERDVKDVRLNYPYLEGGAEFLRDPRGDMRSPRGLFIRARAADATERLLRALAAIGGAA